MSDTYYKILGVPSDAGLQEIKSAYKAMAMKYHPDRNPDNPHAEEQFKAINEIYQTLSDPYKRATYDYLLVYRSQQADVPHYTPSQTTYHPPQTSYYQNTAGTPSNTTQTDPAAHIPKRTKQMIILAAFVLFLGICVVAVMLHRFSRQLHADRLLEQAKAQITQNDEIKALKNLNLLLSKAAPKAEYLEMRAGIWLNYHNYWKAIEDYTQLLKLSEEGKPQWYFHRGKAYFYLYQYEAAQKDFDKAIDLNSTQEAYFMYRAILKKRMKKTTADICEDWEKGKKDAQTFYSEEMQDFCQ